MVILSLLLHQPIFYSKYRLSLLLNGVYLTPYASIQWHGWVPEMAQHSKGCEKCVI